MKYQKVFEMLEKFTTLAAQETVYQSPVNIEFQNQRDRLTKFYGNFQSKLRAIISEIDGEIRILRERKFDDKMMKLLLKFHQDLISIYKEIDQDNPYPAAEKLVYYVLESPNKHIINNLDFLAKHHLQQTNVSFMAGKILQHPEIRGLAAVKELAGHLRSFMAQYPMIKPPPPLPQAPATLQENLQDVPAFFSKEDEKTKI